MLASVLTPDASGGHDEPRKNRNSMSNSKKIAIARKHRRKRRAAKHKVHDFLHTKGGKAADLPDLARRALRRRLRTRAN
jgi:hypothetical protein